MKKVPASKISLSESLTKILGWNIDEPLPVSTEPDNTELEGKWMSSQSAPTNLLSTNPPFLVAAEVEESPPPPSRQMTLADDSLKQLLTLLLGWVSPGQSSARLGPDILLEENLTEHSRTVFGGTVHKIGLFMHLTALCNFINFRGTCCN